MIYQKITPSEHLRPYIESYWIIDSENDVSLERHKIVPDGFPEMIFHYGDAYRINIVGNWEVQSVNLFAGQFRNHFHLENTGHAGMLGIKFKPAAVTQLFGLDMKLFTDKVTKIESCDLSLLTPLLTYNLRLDTKEDFIKKFETIIKAIKGQPKNDSLLKAVSIIQNSHGLVPISELALASGKSERQLERLFSKFIGLSPKFYSRIIRLGHIFELMQSKDNSWSDLVYESGFYDQSHFIKNFKEFTGEDPSAYGFDEKNMANFHLSKN